MPTHIRTLEAELEALRRRGLGEELEALRAPEALRAERDRLAAEVAVLRGAAADASNTWRADLGSSCHDDAIGSIRTALSSPSPLTAAVQRVLEAVGRVREHLTSVRETIIPGDEPWSLFWQSVSDLEQAHDHLQALLEGRGEGGRR